MSKYIDVDLLKSKIPEVEPDETEWCPDCKMMSKDQVEEIIDSIEPIEVVLCRDCKWWTKCDDSPQGHCMLMKMSPTGGWFCANGRKE